MVITLTVLVYKYIVPYIVCYVLINNFVPVVFYLKNFSFLKVDESLVQVQMTPSILINSYSTFEKRHLKNASPKMYIYISIAAMSTVNIR